MERNPALNAGRRARRASRIPEGAACAVCGEDDVRVLEVHHVFGAANDRLTVYLCRNHHTIQTDLQLASGAALGRSNERTVLERLEAALRSLASFFRQLSDALADWADRLRDLVAQLDERLPAWRTLPASAYRP